MAYTAYTLISPTSGLANTKGAYAQVVASTPYASSRLFIITEFASASLRFFLLDIATGGAGAETVVVSNIALDSNSDNCTAGFIPISVDIPAGTRVSVRIQSNTTTQTVTLGVLLEDRALASLANPSTYGTDTGNSRGTQIDPGTTINTKGTYVQLSASTSSRIDVLALCLTIGVGATAITTGVRWMIDVATGGAGAETIVIPDITVVANSPADAIRPATLWFPISIPASTRLAVRCSCSLNTATVRLLCVTLIGMQEAATGGGVGAAGAVAYVG